MRYIYIYESAGLIKMAMKWHDPRYARGQGRQCQYDERRYLQILLHVIREYRRMDPNAKVISTYSSLLQTKPLSFILDFLYTNHSHRKRSNIIFNLILSGREGRYPTSPLHTHLLAEVNAPYQQSRDSAFRPIFLESMPFSRHHWPR